MVIAVLIALILLFTYIDVKSDENSGESIANAEENGEFEPYNRDLHRKLFTDYQNNWYYGDKSLTPAAYRSFFTVNNRARLDYASAWTANEEWKAGYRPMVAIGDTKHEYDAFAGFNRKWGFAITDYNRRNGGTK